MKKILSIILLLWTLPAHAQRHHEIGLIGGVASYYGDLQDKAFPSYGYRQMAGIVYKFALSPHFNLRFAGIYGAVTGADSLSDIPVHQARNLRFGSNIFEVHGGLEFNFLPIDVDRFKVSPYVFAAVGAFYSNPYTDGPNNERVYLMPLSTEGQGLAAYPDRKPYPYINACFPLGGGLKFLISNTLMISAEVGFRYTTTDYLDDVSKSYVDLNVLEKGRGAQSAQFSYRGDELASWDGYYYPKYKYERGDPNHNDWYMFAGINVNIYFDAFGNFGHYRLNCPR